MDLEAWVLPAGRLGLVAACAAALCCPATAGDKPQVMSAIGKFDSETTLSLLLMLKIGPQVLSVTDDEIVLSSIERYQCNGTTQPNVLQPETFKAAVDALNAINNAAAQGRKIKVTKRNLGSTNCMTPVLPATPPASAPNAPASPASAASR